VCEYTVINGMTITVKDEEGICLRETRSFDIGVDSCYAHFLKCISVNINLSLDVVGIIVCSLLICLLYSWAYTKLRQYPGEETTRQKFYLFCM